MDMLRTARHALGASLVAAAAACGSSASPYPLATLAPSHDVSRTLDVMLRSIGPRALAADPSRPVYDVVMSLWPNVMDPPWALRTTPGFTQDRLAVYANGLLLGGAEVMRSVQAHEVARVRRITPSEELMLFGRQHVAGAVILDWSRER